MFFSYTVSVVLLSLAILGLCRLVMDCWRWYGAPSLQKVPSMTFLLIIRNQEEEIEQIVRFLMTEMLTADIPCEVVVVAWGSTDLTPLILSRLVEENPAFTVLYAAEHVRPASEALPLCRGEVVHVFDLVSRLHAEKFLSVAAGLLKSY